MNNSGFLLKALFLFLALSTSAVAQSEKILLPIAIRGEVAGAFGSRWTSEAFVRNDSDDPVRVGGPPCQITCPNEQVGARQTQRFFFDYAPTPGDPLFVYAGGVPFSQNVHLTLRIQDVSRQALTWGTEIPVVRVADLHSRKLILLNVPTGARFRQTLRMYDFDRGETRLRVRVYPLESNVVLADEELYLSSQRPEIVPAFARINHLVEKYPQIVAHETVRIEISPTAANTRFWAFVSVTNNETQHVTTIVPDKPPTYITKD